MSGYLQRLLDSALPAAAPAALTPVVKSTSPVFEQDQLLGLTTFQAGETDAEITAAVSEDPWPQGRSAPAPPVAAAAVRPLEIAQELPTATPAPWPGGEVDPPLAASLPAPRPVAPDVAGQPQEPSVAELGPELPGPEILGPAMPSRSGTAPVSEPAAGVPETRMRANPAPAPADTPEGGPVIPSKVSFAPERQENAAVPAVLAGDTEHALEPPVRALDPSPPAAALEPLQTAPDTSPPLSVLEPRPRLDFRDVADADRPEPASLQAPRITIGRVTVELVPDPAPRAKSSGPPRTAAAASMIGPLGNRRARRRLFALSRL